MKPTNCIFSDDRVYRYTWECPFGDKLEEFNYVQFIGLNPSTADENGPDPTVTRCTNFVKSWGYNGFVMTNLFAVRTPHPKVMMAHPSPVGPDNNMWLINMARSAAITVCAWGNDGRYGNRAADVLKLLSFADLHYLKMTGKGQPWHPLYLKSDLKPVPFKQQT